MGAEGRGPIADARSGSWRADEAQSVRRPSKLSRKHTPYPFYALIKKYVVKGLP